VIEALRAESVARGIREPQVLYVGSEGGVERDLVQRAGIDFVTVPSGGLHGLGLRRVVVNLVKLVRGWIAAYQLGSEARPAAALVTGGYASVPVALGAWSRGAPVLVYLPDIEPGLAVRFLARIAAQIAVSVEESRAFLPARKVVVTGYPLGERMRVEDRTTARGALGLEAQGPVVLVLGGSTGARSINRAVDGVLEEVLEVAQVIHVTGTADRDWADRRRSELGDRARKRYRLFTYLHEEIGLAFAAADLVVSRSGASTLGELPAFGVPAILVPYPYAWRYQTVNAEWLAERGAAVRLDDGRLGEDLLPTVRELLGNQALLERMSARMAALARPDAAKRVADSLLSLTARAGRVVYGTA
jgi:UDP-N-acetylglucosamine--N-acetylmuramyl-(pentapeptide) pyrophosphoryl-undecaprenol N-acetylglucosamine transferase